MEDQPFDQPQVPTPAPPQPPNGVMDVKPPQASAAGVPSSPLPSRPTVPTSPEPVDTAAPPGLSVPLEHEHVAAPPAAEHDVHQLLAAHAGHKNRPPLAAIIVAVVIALALIGVTIFAYMSTRNTTHQQGDDHTPAEEMTQQQSASPSDVDDASQEVDATLSTIDDNKDLPESDLTDQTLGL